MSKKRERRLDREAAPVARNHWEGDPRQITRRRWRRQCLVRHLHALGARPIFEFLDELARLYDIGADIDRRSERYGQLDRDVLAALGGDRFPPDLWRVR